MAKKLQIFDIPLDHYSTQDNMRFLEEYLERNELNLISLITSELLLMASEEEDLRAFIMNADLQVITDPTVLEIADGNNEEQYVQIQKKELEEQFLHYLIRKRKCVYWLGESQNRKEQFLHYMKEHYADLEIAGAGVCSVEETNDEQIVNEINRADAEVLILNIESPRQEQFISRNKQLLHARLCICAGTFVRAKFSSGVRISRLKSLIDQTMFKRKALKYTAEENKEH